jgi:acyl carrier protein phosphodiesterase
MISDFVKGKKKFDYPAVIQQGITLHRAIDQFTDSHEATRAAKKIFRADYGLYSGALMDVIYDHFLALDEKEFSEQTLHDFASQVYADLGQHARWFPETFALIYPYMSGQNWLYHYRTREGIAKSLHGIVRRAKYLTESQTAYQLFEGHYQLLNELYRQFWKDLKPFAMNEWKRLSS